MSTLKNADGAMTLAERWEEDEDGFGFVDDKAKDAAPDAEDGGQGSGNWGHKGRAGQVGGSGSGGFTQENTASAPDFHRAVKFMSKQLEKKPAGSKVESPIPNDPFRRKSVFQREKDGTWTQHVYAGSIPLGRTEGFTTEMVGQEIVNNLPTNDGGPGSGNFNHEGRPGEVGGSGDGGASGASAALNDKLKSVLVKRSQSCYSDVLSILEDAPVGSELTFACDDGDEYTVRKTGADKWDWDGEASSDDIASSVDYSKGTKAARFNGNSEGKAGAKTYTGAYANVHKAIDEAKTTSEANEALRGAGIFSSSQRCNLRGAKTSSAKEVAHTALEMVERYPWMKRKVARVAVIDLGGLNGAYTNPNAYSGGNEIHLDKRRLQRDQSYPTITRAGEEFPVGTGSHASDYAHEFGHAMAHTLAKKLGKSDDELCEMIRAAALKKAGVKDNDGAVTNALSHYAAKNAEEFVAEAVSEYHASVKKPRALCVACVEEINRIAKEAKLK